jgi:4-hydroxy-2-oxoheptanedioate aldolase
MHEAVAAIAATGVSPLVRIPANEPWMVKRALDTGAHGICVPLLETVSDAEKLVSSTKFPPQGTRGFGSPFPMEKFVHGAHQAAVSDTDIAKGLTTTDYLLQANDSLVTVAQIETSAALSNVEAIAQVEGIDVLLVGPFDLGNNIGHPILDGTISAPLQKAIDKIQAAAKAAGKGTGIYCTTGEQAREFKERGFNMISVAADMIAIPAYFAQALATARGEGASREKMTGPYGR